MKYPNKYFKRKSCRYCEKEFQPTAPSQLYCCDKCTEHGVIQRHYKKSYGLKYKEVIAMREKQDNVCAICKTSGFMMNDRVKSALNVDHDHKTGLVRGMLCHNCNRALGLFQDDIEIIQSAIDYLKGATTIPSGSTEKSPEAHNSEG
jgi:predicted nucleic acid-binding Zn ribbon protein